LRRFYADYAVFRNEDLRTRILETRISGLKDLEDEFIRGLG
jgi:hypothetical protein